MRAGVWRRALVTTCLLACALVAPAAAAEPRAELTSTIAITPGDGETTPPRLTHTVELTLPADDPSVAALSRYEARDDAYRYTLSHVLDAYTPFARHAIHSALEHRVVERPRLKIDGGRATLELVLGDQIYGDRERSSSALLELAADAGVISIRTIPRDRYGRSELDTLTVPWRIALRLDGATLWAARPVPLTTDGRTSAEWTFAPRTEPDVSARAALDDSATQSLVADDAVARYAKPISFTLVPAIPLILVLIWGFRPTAPAASARTKVRGYMWRGVLLALALALAWALTVGSYDLVEALFDDSAHFGTPERVKNALQAGVPLLAVALLRLRGSRERRVAVGALVAGTVGIGVTAWFGPVPGAPERGWAGDRFGDEAIGVACVVYVAAFVYLALSGIARAVAAAAPRERPRRWATIRRLSWWGLGALCAGVVVQWWAYARESVPVDDGRDLSSARWAEESLGYDPTASTGPVDDLVRTAFDVPIQLAGTLSPLLAYLAVAGLLAVMHARSRGDARRPIADVSQLRWPATLVFATAVVGTNGQIDGIAVPTAFAASLLLFRAALQERLGGYEHRPEDERAWRRDLLSRSVGTEELRSKDRALYDKFVAGELAEDVYFRRSDALAHEHASRCEGTGIPSQVAPTELALALGPCATWWDNGKKAAGIGLKVSVIPVAYFVAVVVARGGLERAFSNNYPTELLNLASALAGEVVFWAAAAFVLGAAYPHLRGTNGPLKALTLAAVFAGAQLVAAAIEPGTQDGWQFRALQLGLFLVAVGVWMDRETLGASRLHWRHLLDTYRVSDARFALGYASSVLVALIVIAQQIRSGEGTDAVTGILEAIPNFLPGG